MAFWSALSRLLTILAVVSLVAVGASAASSGAGMNGSGPVVATVDDMSCCDQPPPDCGTMKACPFAVLCVTKCPQSAPTATPIVVRAALAVEIIPYRAQFGDGLPAPPPEHPPKA
ncbi:hypothetical protein ACFOYU_10025 [Microvirga sp. GCM10011540]|uniref:hypothetical protein n=1 Tax=Microvirga sp. GCM10011540 TaxID=3317338 RepID=UPI003612F29F